MNVSRVYEFDLDERREGRRGEGRSSIYTEWPEDEPALWSFE